MITSTHYISGVVMRDLLTVVHCLPRYVVSSDNIRSISRQFIFSDGIHITATYNDNTLLNETYVTTDKTCADKYLDLINATFKSILLNS